MAGHARLAPSNARWPRCAGSVREEAQYEDVAGAAAIDGTGSHLLLELCMDNNVRAEAYCGQIIGVNHHDAPNGWVVHRDRADRVQMALDYIAERHRLLSVAYPGATITIESETHADPGGAFGRDDWYGTVDVTITVMMDGHVLFIEIADYKDGRGWVGPKGNTQFISYAFGKIRPHVGSGPQLVKPFKPAGVRDGVKLTVMQPRTTPVIRSHDMTTEQLINEAQELAAAAHRTDEPDAPLTPGKHCQWCKANPKRGGHCAAELDKNIEEVKAVGTGIIATDGGGDLFEQAGRMLANVRSLSSDQLADLYDAWPAIAAGFERVGKEIEKRIGDDDEVPRYAMKPGRKSRVWALSEEEIAKKLKARRLKNADIYPPKLITPAAALKLSTLTSTQKEKLEAELIVEKAGDMKLTRVAAKEEVDTKSMFAGVTAVKSIFDDTNTEGSVAQCQTEDVQCSQQVEEAPVSFM